MFKDGMKIWGVILLVFLGLSIIGIITKVVLFPTHVANKALDASYGIVDKTVNADNILFNYENFHNMYQGAIQQSNNIINTEKSIETLKQTYGNNPTQWPKDVRSELSHQQQTLQGYQAQYQRIKSDYNADSQKLNRNLFKEKSLPYMLPDDYKMIN